MYNDNMKISTLELFNSWWTTGRVNESVLKIYKRKSFTELMDYIKRKPIMLIYGLRRIGKTTLIMQAIDNLLHTTNPKNILYFSFDEESADLTDLLETYQKLVLHNTFNNISDKVYVFLDEIQKSKNWSEKIKIYYDLFPNLKFIVTGSATVNIKMSKESLAGRVIDLLLPPLSFEEFLELSGIDIKKVKEDIDLWKRKLVPLLYKYIKLGMLPELVGEDEKYAKDYIKSLTDRVVYRDLPEEFGIKDIELIGHLLKLVAENPGIKINYKNISNDFGRDQRTIANYFDYLEYSMLIRFVYNYRGSPIASMRKLKKVYPYIPNISFAYADKFSSVLPQLIEDVVIIHANAKFFYSNGFEVDVIKQDGSGNIAIEIKKGKGRSKQIKKIKEKLNIKKSFLISIEDEGKVDGIDIIPLWKWLLSDIFP